MTRGRRRSLARRRAGALLLAVFAPAAGARQAASEQSLAVAAYAAEGDFGEHLDTAIRYFPVTYEFSRGPWGFQLLAPHLRVTGPGTVVLNLGGVRRAVADARPAAQRGLGDVVASVRRRFVRADPAAWQAELRLDVKFPTADEEKGLGTGETDYSAQLDLSRAGAATVYFVTFGYQMRGRSGLFPGLEDSPFAQLGLAHRLGRAVTVGAVYDYRGAASSFTPEVHELLPYAAWRLSERWSLTALTGLGFTEASADLSLMGQLRYSW